MGPVGPGDVRHARRRVDGPDRPHPGARAPRRHRAGAAPDVQDRPAGARPAAEALQHGGEDQPLGQPHVAAAVRVGRGAGVPAESVFPGHHDHRFLHSAGPGRGEAYGVLVSLLRADVPSLPPDDGN
ncbi:hypothetical protein [Streptomyces sp. NPDC006309]|uniref:hypothetical protein n=1 Tax=Streptomyces sp. NPDC006309 TaxID=3156749 RepID=UPI0033BEA75D